MVCDTHFRRNPVDIFKISAICAVGFASTNAGRFGLATPLALLGRASIGQGFLVFSECSEKYLNSLQKDRFARFQNETRFRDFLSGK